MIKAIVFRIFIFIAFILIFSPQTATGQVNQYARMACRLAIRPIGL